LSPAAGYLDENARSEDGSPPYHSRKHYRMTEDPAKAAARARVADLVQKFKRNEADHLSAIYNETLTRTEFITPLLEAFGWDVRNANRYPMALREVIEEATVEVASERFSRKPDYELRMARQRKIFVEAKKPSVHIERDSESAFQTRRYGYSASLPISILTNFHHLAIYDCLPVPLSTDEAHVARHLLVRYDQYEVRFDELWSLISRQSVYSGDFDRHFAVDATRHGAQQFDDLFLRQVRSWRERLAVDIHSNSPGLTPTELTYAVQIFLSRIVFLRVCEDREIENYETLKRLPASNTFDALMRELRRADEFYDSGLFRLLDDERLGVRISNDVLQSIITELYYPQSPYTFAVVETEVLGEIYEQFLGEQITVSSGVVTIVRKPEVRESGGVVPTPRYISDAIVERALVPALRGKSPSDLAGFTIADICCGSGIFLLSAYEFILEHHLNWYLENNRTDHIGRTIYEITGSQWRLTFGEKRRILLAHIRGVDIDPNAVEVARFSLLLKLIENETIADLRDYVNQNNAPALPLLDNSIRCGNSLVSQAEWSSSCTPMSAVLVDKINPFTWSEEFPSEMGRGGFDIIVGNPPYIRIQNMTAYSPEEVAFYKNTHSPYSTARQDNFDKYALFIERALSLLRPEGRLGVISPHKFMTTQAGRTLRRLIANGRFLEEIVHFGVKQVFGRNIANYTCILILDRRGHDMIHLERPGPLQAWRYGAAGSTTDIPTGSLGEDNWQFADTETSALFERIRTAHPNRLGQIAEIFVGVQTSADSIYIFFSVTEDADTVTLRWNGRDWPIERGILRPCLHDVPLFAYARPQPNAWMIFPYEIVTGRTRPLARLINLGDMDLRFPRCLAYLEARRSELDLRHVTGGSTADRQFYQFGRSQSLVKFDSSKIILPALSLEPRYAFDDNNIVVTGGGNGPYYLLRVRQGVAVTNHYLLAILNHSLSEALVRTNTSMFGGGYYSHGKQFIQNLPIPIPTDSQRLEVEALVIQLIDTLDAIATAGTPHQRTIHERQTAELRGQIDVIVGNLFGLSPADMDVVRAVPVPD
jgi:type I restriction-modification system DNA methylase subunit